ncbi:type I restriction endonuclease subunit R [Flavobacterium aquatile]|uniref:Type I restriction enzyme endonuclease subunit n=1 Tax=Flavobacterium aquatile LMG 4008 = ATCC 11947 TaxID=1453498 RepID=A0A095STA9_9FLAO|nr:type I restriction endonuclease subunit R [Flavobacterium aquatile]KGD67569.1 deoxyribonuclease HsdR [Flavobacterium aquatile LMG 4008 = ATCC 11947]OXA65498.1 deoxyribonuclease HsdR [Flavobacterium aquatile] [Flavobacterium aquatile LMG 4008 = ATCC 11947]GEC80228.1 type I restriction endonuclease [Flavobacterium aquatile]
MGHQSEAQLERNLIQQLVGLGYALVTIADGSALVANLQQQLEVFNDTTFTAKEFDAILNHLAKGNVFEKAKMLRDRFQLTKEDGTSFYVRFFNTEDWNQNLYQVTNQISQEGSYKNRYDVTLLVNGLPLVQIELKRSGIEIKEAFNQINRYQNQSFWSNHGLFQYVQLFVISNGVNTKYLANNKLQSVKQTFFWADSTNKITTELPEFAASFLNPNHLGKMIAHYIVINETHKVMMVLRPYQYFATEAIIHQVKNSNDNAYIWHTTGSGKTLTSFKASQIVMDLPEVYKVVFVVDRKDLDYQTMTEFNAFKKDSVDVTDNTQSLVNQLTDNTKLVLTTIQKLNNAVSERFAGKIESLRHKKIVFIFDECHRSQFGETHERITKFFDKSQLIGFTGTPIFAENASKNELGKRTTKDLFGNCLHKYVITDAIRDQNVLRFGIEYIGKYKNKSNTFIDIEVEDIDKQEVLNSAKRIEKIVDYIIAYHKQKTFEKEYSALLAVSSIDNVFQYYDFFQQKKEAGLHDLRIATIFTYGSNEDSDEAQDYLPEDTDFYMAAEPSSKYQSSHSRDKLDSYIVDYNKMYGTSFSTKDSKQFENYFKNISQRLKDREKESFNYEKDGLDLVIVVNMMLTGFDAKKVNTLYVDKNLKQHGLIQAYSRTNRILGEQKSQGNILAFRNLKKATDDAITLFSNKDAIEVATMPDYEKIAEKFEEALKELRDITPTYQSVNDLETEDAEALFVQAFRKLLRNMNVLQSYADFDWEDLQIDEQEFEDYKSKYLDLYQKVKQDNQKQKTSILDDIDFELELIHRDQINVAYILKLLSQLKGANTSDAKAQRKAIMDLLGGDIQLRSKRELIQKFIDENLPNIKDADRVNDEFEKFWQEQKVLALGKLCEDEHLDKAQFKALIDAYIYSGREPIKDEVFQCLDNRPSILQARVIGERIISKMKEFVEVFVKGMVA